LYQILLRLNINTTSEAENWVNYTQFVI